MKRLLCMVLALLIAVCLCTSALGDTLEGIVLRPEGNGWQPVFSVENDLINTCSMQAALWEDGILLTFSSPWTKPGTLFLSRSRGACLMDNDSGQWYRLTVDGLPLSLQQLSTQLQEATGFTADELLILLKADAKKFSQTIGTWCSDLLRLPPVYMLTRKLANIADVTIDLSGRDISAALTTILSRLPWGTLSSPSNALDDYYLGSIYADLVTDNLYQLNHTLTELYRIAHNFPDFNLSGNLLDETGKLSFTCKGTAISISYALDEQARVVNISGDVILDGNAPITIAGQLTEHNLTISCDSPDVRNTLNLTIPSDLFTGLITLNITEIRLHNGKVSSTTAWSADLAPERNGFVLSFDADYKNRIYLSYHLYDEQIELSVSDANVSSTLTLTNEQDSLVLAGDFRQPFLIPEPFRLALRLSPAEVTVAPLSDSMTDLEFSALPNLFIRE